MAKPELVILHKQFITIVSATERAGYADPGAPLAFRPNIWPQASTTGKHFTNKTHQARFWHCALL
jgi:hypothetical protein